MITREGNVAYNPGPPFVMEPSSTELSSSMTMEVESFGCRSGRGHFGSCETSRIELCLPLNILVGWPETIDLVSPPPIESKNQSHMGPSVSEPMSPASWLMAFI